MGHMRIVGSVLLVSALPLLGGSRPPEAAELGWYQEQLASSEFNARREAAKALVAETAVPAEQRIAVLLGALRAECENPLSREIPQEAYASITEILKRQYMHSVRDIGGPALAQAQGAAKAASGEFASRLVLLRALLGEGGLGGHLQDLVRKAPDGYLRSYAARLLGDAGATEAIPALKDALSDPFWVVPKECDRGPGDPGLYPVASEAAGALRRLGVEVRRERNRFFVVEAVSSGSPPATEAAFATVAIGVNGKEAVDGCLASSQGTVYLPLLAVCARLDLKTQVDPEGMAVEALFPDGREVTVLRLAGGANEATGAEPLVLDAKIVEGELFVTPEFFARRLGCSVIWDPVPQSMYITLG